jgi:hypothetical protein
VEVEFFFLNNSVFKNERLIWFPVQVLRAGILHWLFVTVIRIECAEVILAAFTDVHVENAILSTNEAAGNRRNYNDQENSSHL